MEKFSVKYFDKLYSVRELPNYDFHYFVNDGKSDRDSTRVLKSYCKRVKTQVMFEKGYTLEVESWENDGDNYRTKYYHVDTIEGVDAIIKICDNMFDMSYTPTHSISNNIYNSFEDYEDIVKDFFEQNEDVRKYFKLDDNFSNEDVIFIIQELGYELMG